MEDRSDSTARPDHRVAFTINDQAQDYPTRVVDVFASGADITALVDEGYLRLPGLLERSVAADLAEVLTRIAEIEAADPDAELLPGQNIYLRSLLDKDRAFHPLLTIQPALSIARRVLGPQVWVQVEGRLTFGGVPDVAVPWHVHMPVVPRPLPPFFCYPHQIHCLLYLDPVGDAEGPLCVLPGSHLSTEVALPLGECSDQAGQVELRFQPGDAVLIHGNLWHRVPATVQAAGPRRLLLLGFGPSWVRPDTDRGVTPAIRLTDELRRQATSEIRELLGEFGW